MANLISRKFKDHFFFLTDGYHNFRFLKYFDELFGMGDLKVNETVKVPLKILIINSSSTCHSDSYNFLILHELAPTEEIYSVRKFCVDSSSLRYGKVFLLRKEAARRKC